MAAVRTYTASLAPPGARSILLVDARRGGDEWLLVVVAFDLPADTDALAAGALEALGLRGGAEFGPAAPQAALLNAMLGGAMRLVVPWVAR